jgi:hypothetical protein
MQIIHNSEILLNSLIINLLLKEEEFIIKLKIKKLWEVFKKYKKTQLIQKDKEMICRFRYMISIKRNRLSVSFIIKKEKVQLIKLLDSLLVLGRV